MTLEQLVNKINEELKETREKLRKSDIEGNKRNHDFFMGVERGLRDVLCLINSLKDGQFTKIEESKGSMIEVTFQFYSRLLDELRESKKTFKSLEEYSAWLRYIAINEGDINILNVSYVDKE